MADSHFNRSAGAADPAVSSEACPDDNEIAALVEGLLPPADLMRVETHLRGCEACSALFAELGHVLAPDSAVTTGADAGSDPLQRYQLLDTIGAGGMGVVHLAFDRQLQRKVALKVIRPELADTNEARRVRQRLVREARSLASLSHPNVVTVYDVGTLDDQVFIAVEYVEGRNVSQWLAQTRPGWRAILEVYLQAGQGLAAAHAVGLVHRDVKPDNLLVGSDGRVRVTDFGLATSSAGVPATALNLAQPVLEVTGPASHLGAGLGVATAPTVAATPHAGVDPAAMTVPQDSTWSPGGLTTQGAVVGTPAYMAPEQLAGGRADARSDQFSFCVSLYEALYGPRPYQGATFGALLEQMRAGRLVPPAPVRPGEEVPAPVYDTLRAGLHPDPAARWPSVQDLVSALMPALAPPPSRERARIWRPVAVIGVIAAVLLAVVVGVILATGDPSGTGTGTGAGAGAKKAQPKPLTARQLLMKFLDPAADHRSMTQALRPRATDCKAYFVASLADRACAYYTKMYQSRRAAIRPSSGQNQLLLRAATVEQLRQGGREAHYFPGGYKRTAAYLKPGHTVYRFKFVKYGERLGMAYDGLVHLNGRWVFFPKPWRVLRDK